MIRQVFRYIDDGRLPCYSAILCLIKAHMSCPCAHICCSPPSIHCVLKTKTVEIKTDVDIPHRLVDEFPGFSSVDCLQQASIGISCRVIDRQPDGLPIKIKWDSKILIWGDILPT